MSRRTHAPPPRRSQVRSFRPRVWLRSWLPPRKAGAEADASVRSRASGRVAWLGAAILLGYLALVGRASSLMLLPDPQLEAKARIQFEEAVEVHGRRGDIVDRNHTLLATTVNLYELHVDPWFLLRSPKKGSPHVEDPVSLLAEILSEELEISAENLTRRLRRPGRRDVRVATELTPAALTRIEDRVKATARKQDTRLRSVLFSNATPSRFYPGMSDAAPLLGL
ncbi:MAG TPA: hypothetical protein DFR83_24685, partial [Deltaproteobacteria bacterium]|nr:hypothetical protein [Deltaproteobacteria bacterium]